jgi:hypothetical protein
MLYREWLLPCHVAPCARLVARRHSLDEFAPACHAQPSSFCPPLLPYQTGNIFMRQWGRTANKNGESMRAFEPEPKVSAGKGTREQPDQEIGSQVF